jgi:phenylacetic acid degradation operon negative regulatory protein
VTSADDAPRGQRLPAVELRPQSVLLTFFGDYVREPGATVAAASVIDLLEAAGVGAAATRATLSRMVKRGLLARAPRGRLAYFGLTPFGRTTVLDGRARAQDAEVVNRDWGGDWTIVAFSLPESAQRERHVMRSRLGWAGFGMVQAGLWAAPRDIDVVSLLSDLAVLPHVTAFRGTAAAPTDPASLVSRAFDLTAIAARYSGFARRWGGLGPDGLGGYPDPLAARVVLGTDWLQVIRADPRLPVEFLDPGWPAFAAQDLYRGLEARLRGPAERAAASRLVPGPPVSRAGGASRSRSASGSAAAPRP